MGCGFSLIRLSPVLNTEQTLWFIIWPFFLKRQTAFSCLASISCKKFTKFHELCSSINWSCLYYLSCTFSVTVQEFVFLLCRVLKVFFCISSGSSQSRLVQCGKINKPKSIYVDLWLDLMTHCEQQVSG